MLGFWNSTLGKQNPTVPISSPAWRQGFWRVPMPGKTCCPSLAIFCSSQGWVPNSIQQPIAVQDLVSLLSALLVLVYCGLSIYSHSSGVLWLVAQWWSTNPGLVPLVILSRASQNSTVHDPGWRLWKTHCRLMQAPGRGSCGWATFMRAP